MQLRIEDAEMDEPLKRLKFGVLLARSLWIPLKTIFQFHISLLI